MQERASGSCSLSIARQLHARAATLRVGADLLGGGLRRGKLPRERVERVEQVLAGLAHLGNERRDKWRDGDADDL